jgi:hypothetical protein
MIARHLLWHVGVAAGAVMLLSLFGLPLSSALPVGIMAGCVAMLFGGGHSGHGHEASGRQPEPHREVEPR